MATSPNGKLIEEYTEAGRPFVFGEKNLNAQRMIQVDQEGQIMPPTRPTIVGYSTEVKPAGIRGDSFLELDTTNVYIHDGSSWVVF